MRLKISSLFVAFLATSLSLIVSQADAQTLFSDTFSRTTGSGLGNGNPDGDGNGSSDWGAADNGLGGTETVNWIAGRNGGPTGGAQFTTNGSRAHLFSGAAHTTTNIAGSAADGFEIAFDFGRVDLGLDATNGFISVGTGYDETVNEFSPFEVTGNSQFAVLFQQAANGNTGNASVFADGNLLTNFDYGDPLTEHSVLIALAPNTSGSYGDSDNIGYEISVDGNVQNSGSITGGAGFGDLAFATNLFSGAYIDNLQVTAVPEPGSLIVLMSGLFAASLVRRRTA